MKNRNFTHIVAICLTIVGISTVLVSCGGAERSVLSGTGGSLQIRVSATDGSALRSAIPAGALASRTTGGVTALDGSGGSNPPQLQAFDVTFSSITAVNPEGVEVPVTIALPATIDLLALAGGNTAELPIGFLPAGEYQGFVVRLSAVALVLQDGTRLTIQPPGDGWSVRIRTAPFEVVDGQPTTVELSIRLGQALRWIRDHFDFQPIFDCHVHGHDHDGDDDGDDDHDDDGDDQGR